MEKIYISLVNRIGNNIDVAKEASAAKDSAELIASGDKPDIPMLLLFIPFPIKLKTLASAYIIIEVISQITNPGGHTAYLAHILGFVFGYLFMRIVCKEQIAWDPLKALFGSRKDQQNGLPPGWKVSGPAFRQPGSSVSRDEVQRLLIKLSREGINALTEEEQATLRRAREEMMNRR